MKRTVVCLMVFAVAGVALPLHHLAPLVANGVNERVNILLRSSLEVLT